MILKTKIFGKTYKFDNVKEVLAKANEEKSGDILAGVAAASGEERVAAKRVLSQLTLEDLRNNPVVPYEDDEVTRIIQDNINEKIYGEIKNLSVAEFREKILSHEITGEDIKRMSRGLTSEMVAGLAKQFKPFLVNTVVGFIGPEYLYDSKQVIRAGLEDHFMGKLTGIPMGCDACYTNHMKADQNDIENLAVLLGAAGCNYFMGIPMGDDVMLNYQCTSFHDMASLRTLLNLRPLPEFEKWLEKMGIMKNGKLTQISGDASLFTR